MHRVARGATTASYFLNEAARNNPSIQISKGMLDCLLHVFEANIHEMRSLSSNFLAHVTRHAMNSMYE